MGGGWNMDTKQLKRNISNIQKEIKSLKSQIKPLEKKLDELFDMLEIENNKLVEKSLGSLSLEEKIDFFLNTPKIQTSLKHSEAMKFFGNIGLGYSGLNIKTNQPILQVVLKQDCVKSLNTALYALKMSLSFVKSDNNGIKYISILEHTCGEDGIYHIEISDNHCDVILCSRNKEKLLRSFGNLRECLEYVQENHYYR